MDRAEWQLNPFSWYRTMRESRPVYYDREDDSWSVFRYDDVERVLSDYTTFSSRFQGEGGRRDRPLAASLISTDPPRHKQLRSLVSQAFTPKAIAQLEPRIKEITDELLDRVAPAGQMDVVADLAYPLPVIVIAEMLGIRVEDREQFKRWSDAVVGAVNGQYIGGQAQMEMGQYFLRVLEERRREPKEDLISGLLAAEVDGQRLSELDLLGFGILLLVAGNETTTSLIGNAMLCFDEHPEAMEELRTALELVPDAIEEVLRYRSPVRSMFRVITVDTRLGDQDLRAGQSVVAWIGSANRDEAQFPDAERFDIRRSPNRHLAFGHGIHYCLGAPLARLEAKIALRALLGRFRDIRRVPGTKLEPVESFILYGVKRLPVSFQVA